MMTAKLDGHIAMRQSRQQVADAVYPADSRSDPLVAAFIRIHDSPHVKWIERSHEIKILAIGFQAVAAPNIVVRQRMPVGLEVFVKDIFVKYQRSTVCNRRHSHWPSLLKQQRTFRHRPVAGYWCEPAMIQLFYTRTQRSHTRAQRIAWRFTPNRLEGLRIFS